MRTKPMREMLKAFLNLCRENKSLTIIILLISISLYWTWDICPTSLYNFWTTAMVAITKSFGEAVLTSIFITFLFFLLKQKREEEAKRQEIQNSIIDCLGLSPEILDVCREEQIDKILKRCITYYNQDIAEQCQEYIKTNLDVIRKNFEYNIDILENGNDTNSVNIRQYLSYERCFRTQKNKSSYEFKCYFSTSNDLDEQLSVNSLFFREELTNNQLLNKIKILREKMKGGGNEYDKYKSELIELIGLSMYLGENNNPIASNDIEIEINEKGILFSTKIPKIYIKHSISINGDEYVSYKGTVICSYQANINNQFYCIFSNITLGATRFKLTFSENIFRNLQDKSQWDKRVNIVSMLSMKDKNKRPKIDIKANQTIAFTASEGDVIFPRSGIVIHWNPSQNINDQ